MTKPQVHPVFVDRKTAAEMLMISVDTFDTWLRAGFIPGPQIERGQIIRWHWPSLEQSFLDQEPAQEQLDPFLEGLKNIQKPKAKSKRAI